MIEHVVLVIIFGCTRILLLFLLLGAIILGAAASAVAATLEVPSLRRSRIFFFSADAILVVFVSG